MQAHAVFAAGNQHRFAFDQPGEFGRGGGDLGFGGDRTMHSGGKFFRIRRDQRGAAINPVIVMLGIDHHRFAGSSAPFR